MGDTMFNSVLLDVFIGLSLIYVLLSLVMASVIEAVAGMTKMRNSLLESAMREILGEEKYLNLFYHHPMINCLRKKPFFLSLIYTIYTWKISRALRIDRLIVKCNLVKIYHIISLGRPSYLSSKLFAVVLFDLMRGGFDGIRRRYASLIVKEEGQQSGNDSRLVFEFDRNEAYRREEIESWLAKFSYFTEMVDVTERTATDDTPLSIRLMEQQPVLHRVADWFDLQMERLTGVYKRRTQAILFVASFVACCVLNADSIMMATILWSDPVMRNAVVYEATQTVADAQSGDHTGPTAHELNAEASADNACTECGKLSVAEVAAENNLMRPFPIGWEQQRSSVYREYRAMPENFKEFIYKVIGILITTFLVSLGAPFWFDMLSKVVNIRNVGIKPKSAPAASTPERKGDQE